MKRVVEVRTGLYAHASGAAWLPAARAVILAGAQAGDRGRIGDLVRELGTRTVVLVRPGEGLSIAQAQVLEGGAQWNVPGFRVVAAGAPAPAAGTYLIAGLNATAQFRNAAGAQEPVPVFLKGPAGVIVPAFSPTAGASDVSGKLSSEWRGLLGSEEVECLAATGSEVVRIGRMVLSFRLY